MARRLTPNTGASFGAGKKARTTLAWSAGFDGPPFPADQKQDQEQTNERGDSMKHDANEPIKRSLGNQSEVDDRIRLRAYELYERRGCGEGLELDDWVQAEQEILNSGDLAKAA